MLAAFEAAEAAIAPVYTMADLAADPHVQARDALVEVDGVVMPGLVARVAARPAGSAMPAAPRRADTEAVLAELGPEKSADSRGGLE